MQVWGRILCYLDRSPDRGTAFLGSSVRGTILASSRASAKSPEQILQDVRICKANNNSIGYVSNTSVLFFFPNIL